MIEELAFEWPQWLGSPSQLGLLVVVLIVLIKTWPIIQAKAIEAKLIREGRYGERIRHLESELTRCHEECQQRIDKLQTKINNEALNRVQSEISLVHTLIAVVDAPQLQTILTELEKRRARISITEIEHIGEVKGDGDK